ncbi:MAG: hypothetical protein IJ093_02730 [Bacilli bacterium]|nr:hypothetical protein [Bacilli bacterium]
MTIQLVILILALVAVIYVFKNFNACVYFVVMVDIFLRIITYLKANYLRADAFSFFDVIPSNVLSIINSYDLGIFNEVLVILYIIIYIVFEVLLIRLFIRRKF